MSDESQPELVAAQIISSEHKQVVPVYIKTDNDAKSVIDSIGAKWMSALISLVMIPVFLWGGYHIWDESEAHGKALAGILVTQNDIKDTLDGLTRTMITMAQNQTHDENQIAALEQQEKDRPASPPQIIEEHHDRHSSIPKNNNNLLAAIQSILPRGLKARAESHR